MANAISKFIPKFIQQRFAANSKEKSLFYFVPNVNRAYVTKRVINADYLKVLCDDEISSALDTRLDTMMAMSWNLTGGDEGEGGENEFIWNEINKNFYQIVSYSWWAVFFGKSAIQIVYTHIDGRIAIGADYDEDYQQFTYKKGTWLHNDKQFPDGKYFITVNKPSAFNPEGARLADKLHEIYCKRIDGWEFFMKYLEKFGIPFFKIKMGENVSTEDKAAMTAFLESDRPKGVKLPYGTDMDTVDGKTTSVGVFESFETIMRERIQRLILGQTLTTGTGDSGSYALGQVHERVASNKTFSDSIMIEKTINQIVKTIYELNKFTGGLPEFEFQSPKGIQQDVATRDKTLSDVGVTFSKEYFVDTYEFDEGQIDYAPVEPSTGGQPFSQKFGKREVQRFITDEKHKFQASEAEKLENKYIGDSPNMGQVLSVLVKTSKSKADLEKKLRSFLNKDTKEFDEALTDAMLNASVLGAKNG